MLTGVARERERAGYRSCGISRARRLFPVCSLYSVSAHFDVHRKANGKLHSARAAGFDDDFSQFRLFCFAFAFVLLDGRAVLVTFYKLAPTFPRREPRPLFGVAITRFRAARGVAASRRRTVRRRSIPATAARVVADESPPISPVTLLAFI